MIPHTFGVQVSSKPYNPKSNEYQPRGCLDLRSKSHEAQVLGPASVVFDDPFKGFRVWGG